MRRIGYIALSLYLLLVGLSAIIANLMIPNTLMAALALIASFGIFLDACLSDRKGERRVSYPSPSRNYPP
jgi:hypothetical protein